MTISMPPPDRRPSPSGTPTRRPVRRPVPRIPLGLRFFVLGSPFVLAAWILPWYGFLLYSALAGLLLLVTSKACPTCGKRNFQGTGRLFLGDQARCSHCGERFSQ
jgi:hypothetical protein